MMRWNEIPTTPSERTLRQFAGLCLIVFGVMAILQGAKHHPAAAGVFAVLALLLGPTGLIRPALLRPIFVAWMYAVFPVGWTISHAMMALIYYGVFTPIGLVFRLRGRDALLLRRSSRESWWLSKPRVTDKRQYFRQF